MVTIENVVIRFKNKITEPTLANDLIKNVKNK